VEIDYTGSIGRVRLLAADTGSSPIFDDDQYAAFLAIEGGNIRLAAAQALDTIASTRALLARKVKVGPLAIDETTAASELRAHAQVLRTWGQAESAIDIIDFDPMAWVDIGGDE
jgi:hypothetical protein